MVGVKDDRVCLKLKASDIEEEVVRSDNGG